MAFDFLGTWKVSQMQEFYAFIEAHRDTAGKQISSMHALSKRADRNAARFDTVATQLGKALAATWMATEPDTYVTLVKKSGVNDAEIAQIVFEFKTPYFPMIKFFREDVQYRFNRLKDQYDFQENLSVAFEKAYSDYFKIKDFIDSKVSQGIYKSISKD